MFYSFDYLKYKVYLSLTFVVEPEVRENAWVFITLT